MTDSTAPPARPDQSPPSDEGGTALPPGRRVLLGILVALLALAAISMTVAAIDPQTFAGAFGLQSGTLAILIGVAAVLGLAAVPGLGRLGRTGAVCLAVGALAFTILSAVGIPSIPPATGLMPIDVLLQAAMPTGYFLLLFGALRAAGWARVGSLIALIGATLLAVLVLLAGPPLDQVQWMAERAVLHALLIVGAVVAGLAVVIEYGGQRTPSQRSRRSAP